MRVPTRAPALWVAAVLSLAAIPLAAARSNVAWQGQRAVTREPIGQVYRWGLRSMLQTDEADALGVDEYAMEDSWGFVTTKDLHFEVNGKPFWPAGTNAFYMAQYDKYTDDEVYEQFRAHSSRGVTLMRIFAFSNGDGEGEIPLPVPIQPTLGVYNETALARLDLVLAAARKFGVRVILTLANFEDFYGGMRWYVDQVYNTTADKDLFYVSEEIRSYYREYAELLITRLNTVTGVSYRDDPTVFSWELMNEPHTNNAYEAERNITSGTIVLDWIKEMSAFIKSLDSNHMVSTGEEGYRTRGNTDCCVNNWLNDGLKGVDFDANTAVPEIDFATVHAYPDNWGVPANITINWFGKYFLAQRARIAHNLGKPILMEEYGSMWNTTSSRNDLIAYLQDQANILGYAGTLVWEVQEANSTGIDIDLPYVFTYDDLDNGGEAVLAQYAHMETKTLQGVTCVANTAVYGAEPAKGEAYTRNVTTTPLEGYWERRTPRI